MIRYAVGAIVMSESKLMLVHKVAVNSASGEKIAVAGAWDFVKGGKLFPEEQDRDAVFRELYEETGGVRYEIVRRCENPLLFDFPKATAEQTGYSSQHTQMFLVNHLGGEALKPQDDEIDSIEFMSLDEVLKRLKRNETYDYFMKLLHSREIPEMR